MVESKNSLATAAKRYIGDTLGEQTTGKLQPWRGEKALPFYLQERYQAYSLVLNSTPALMVCHVPGETDTPAAIAKHLQAFRKAFDGDVFVVFNTISSHNRKRLIEQKVPFVVPQKQLYLPQFGTVLSEFYSKSSKPPTEQLSPIAQVLLLRHLLGLYEKPKSALVLAKQLGYSKMTLSRAINELVNFDLAETLPVGKEKRLMFKDEGKKLWQQAFSYLISPVQKKVIVKSQYAKNLLSQRRAYIAGESALSKNSMLAKPVVPVIAMAATKYKYPYGKKENLFFEDFWQLELWRYDPRLLIEKNGNQFASKCVDNLSLYLSLNDEKDERVRAALDYLLYSALQDHIDAKL